MRSLLGILNAMLVFAVVFHAALPASATMHASPTLLQKPLGPPGDNVLVVDIRGPSRATGDGVRVMAMLMDLLTCGHKIDVLSDCEDYPELKAAWDPSVAGRVFPKINFWQKKHLDSGVINPWNFKRVIVGAKLYLFKKKADDKVVYKVLQRVFGEKEKWRAKLEVFWDDVPFERCHVLDDADKICPQIPELVHKLANSANTFYLLSAGDKNRMQSEMSAHGINTGLAVRVWPMRLRNMQEALPAFRFNARAPAKKLVTMIGNPHAVNTMMVNALFDSGAIGAICSAIRANGSPVKILFLGGISDVAQAQKDAHAEQATCVNILHGYVNDRMLETKILPITRAVLNPFFEDVKSGISEKNFESVMSGVPFVTSSYGMHGLADEVQSCSGYPLPKLPNDPKYFAEFFIEHIVHESGYQQFASSFEKRSAECVRGQNDMYPVGRVCYA